MRSTTLKIHEIIACDMSIQRSSYTVRPEPMPAMLNSSNCGSMICFKFTKIYGDRESCDLFRFSLLCFLLFYAIFSVYAAVILRLYLAMTSIYVVFPLFKGFI